MFSINLKDPRPIYEQLAENIENLAIKGVLEANFKLPSVRQLSMELSLNPNTVQRAYNTLETKGITYSVRGKGIFISDNYEKFSLERKNQIKQQFFDIIKDALYFEISPEELKDWLEKGLSL